MQRELIKNEISYSGLLDKANSMANENGEVLFKKYLDKPVYSLSKKYFLSNRAQHVLKNNNFTISQFINLTLLELMDIQNCGKKTVKELLAFQKELIITFNHEIESEFDIENAFVLDLNESKEMSMRAQHILNEKKTTVGKFLELTSRDVYRLQNCGAKTAEELIKFQDKLQSKISDLSSTPIEYDPHIKRLKEMEQKFSKSTRDCIDELNLDISNPLSWNLEAHKEKYSVSSNRIRQLADYKAQFFEKQNPDLNFEELVKDQSQISDYYKKYKDFPFIASLFRLDTSEAARILKPIRKIVLQTADIELNSLEDEINFLLPDDKRNRNIILNRFVSWGMTLEDLGNLHGITRERVRQIESKARNNLIKLYDIKKENLFYLYEELKELIKIGDDLSIGILETRYKDSDFINAIIGIALTLSELNKRQVHKSLLGSKIFTEIPTNKYLTIKQSRIIDQLSGHVIRKINRIILNSGAIHIEQIQKIMSVDKKDIKPIMIDFGLKIIADDWYGFKEIDLCKRAPILNSIIKIIQVSPNATFAKAYIGMQKHADRLKFILAPMHILKLVLLDYHCKIDKHDHIHPPIEYTNEHSGAEKLFIECLKRKGPVVTFWDLYNDIVEKGGYSFPSLSSSLLRTSAIVERVDSDSRNTFYTIIGWEYSEADKKNAIRRLPEVTIDINFNRTLDGVSLELSTGLWLKTSGVICITGFDIEEGEWELSLSEEEKLKVVVNDTFIYGLSKMVRKLELNIGDRIILNFNNQIKTIEIQKVLTK